MKALEFDKFSCLNPGSYLVQKEQSRESPGSCWVLWYVRRYGGRHWRSCHRCSACWFRMTMEIVTKENCFRCLLLVLFGRETCKKWVEEQQKMSVKYFRWWLIWCRMTLANYNWRFRKRVLCMMPIINTLQIPNYLIILCISKPGR